MLRTDGATVSANQLQLTAHDLSNVGGEIVQIGASDTTLALAGDLNNNQGRIATNAQNLTLSAQTLTNTDGKIANSYAVNSYPNLYVIDQAGVIASVHVGFGEDSLVEIIDDINALLVKPATPAVPAAPAAAPVAVVVSG